MAELIKPAPDGAPTTTQVGGAPQGHHHTSADTEPCSPALAALQLDGPDRQANVAHSASWQEMLSAERAAIGQRRSVARGGVAAGAPSAASDSLVGLALSGGGIRSATFSLGVLQALHRRGVLPLVDYLSTVSGGGFTGGWWSAWLSRADSAGLFPQGEEVEPSRYPPTLLVPKAGSATERGAPPTDSALSAGNDPIHHVRLFSNYLTPRKGGLSADTWRAVTTIGRNLFLTWLILLPLLFAVVLAGQVYFVARDPVALQFVSGLHGDNGALMARFVATIIPVAVVVAWTLLLTVIWLFYSVDANPSAFVSVVATCVVGWMVYHNYHPSGGPPSQWIHTVGTWVPWWIILGGAGLLAVRYGFVPWISKRWRVVNDREPVPVEVVRNEIVAMHAQLLIVAVLLLGILLVAGFSQDLVWYLFYGGNGVMAAVRKAGGWTAALLSAGSALYTVFAKGAPSGKGGEGPQQPGLLSRLAFKAAPVLVLLSLGITAACSSRAVLVALYHVPGGAAQMLAFCMVGVLLSCLLACAEVFQRQRTEATAGMSFRQHATRIWRQFVPLLVSIPAAFVAYRWLPGWIEGPGTAVGPLVCYFMATILALFAFRLGTRRDLKWKGIPLIWNTLLPGNPQNLQPTAFQEWTPEVRRAVKQTRVIGAGLVVSAWIVAYLLSTTLLFDERIVTDGAITAYACAAFVFCTVAGAVDLAISTSDNAPSTAVLTMGAAGAGVVLLLQSLPAAAPTVHLSTIVVAGVGIIVAWVMLLGWYTDPNQIAVHTFYKSRLVRAYMGASNAKRIEEITSSDAGDDVKLSALGNTARGAPYHLINTTLNLVGGHDLSTSQRSAANFVFAREHCGSARTGYRKTVDYMSDTLTVGTAVAISGAAASPTMGAKSVSSALTLLLALFNVRLGFWAPTPNRSRWRTPLARLWPFYLLREALSQTTNLGTYCYLTDGGHFDNTALYALVERGCKNIIVVDCGADPEWCMSDIGDAVRKCRIDFGAEISLDVQTFRQAKRRKTAADHHVMGRIKYSDAHLRMLGWSDEARKNPEGRIVWIKPALMRCDPADVRQYSFENATYPQQSTANQWYDEAEFESYRNLGYWSAQTVFHAVTVPNVAADATAIETMFTQLG